MEETKTSKNKKRASSKVIVPTIEQPPKAMLKKSAGFWHMLGPGLTTGAADDDPSGIATYSQTGARYGLGLLWLAAFTLPFMSIVQEMCARIGLVTGRGLAANIKQHFPRWVLYVCTALLFLANAFNIGADLGAMAEAARLLWPGLDFGLLVFAFVTLTLVLQIFTSYKKYAQYLKWLTLSLFSYVLTVFLISLDWGVVLKSVVVPTISFSSDQIILISGILGTTISPYLFFWQTSQEVEEEILQGKTTIRERQKPTQEALHAMRIDVWSGMFVSNLVMFCIIVTTGTVLFPHGISHIETAAQAAEALRPLAGSWAYQLFALGIIGTGLLAIPILAGSASYALAESFGWKEGLYRKLKQAQAFYGVIFASMGVGFIINFVGLDPIRALIYSAVANGIVAPVVLVLIVLISSNRKIMGSHVSSRLNTGLGWCITAVMALASLATIVLLLAA